MLLLYTHGLGGSPEAQPEIDEVLAPSGYQINRVVVPYHESVAELLAKLATSTFGDLCKWVHDGANLLIATAQQSAPESYVVVGDSLGGFISLVAAQRDPCITHCILLSCSGDFCDAMMRLDKLHPALRLLAGNFTLSGRGGIKTQAHKAIVGKSDFQHEFDLINTFQPDRLRRLCPLLILGDRGDPVAPESSCRHFAQVAPKATLRMVYDEGRHHSIGKQELKRFVLPFLRDQVVPPSSFSDSDFRSTPQGTSVRVSLRKIWQWLRS